MAMGLVLIEVPESIDEQLGPMFWLTLHYVNLSHSVLFFFLPGATPKNPASGLMALSFPSLSNLIQAISSPTQVILYSGKADFIIAKLVFPHALGKAAAKYFFSPLEFSIPKIYKKLIHY